VNEIIADGVAPVHDAKVSALRVVLIKKMRFVIPLDNAVGVVHPIGRCCKVINRPVKIVAELTTLLNKNLITCCHVNLLTINA
jgi:hypothetical protein